MKRYIPSLVAVLLLAAVASVAATGPAEGVVNINTASSEQLQLLPRVGPALAQRIIEFRESSGPFRSVDEIIAVKGIGESSFERLEPYIVTSGATTLSEKVASQRSTGGSGAAD